MPQGKWGSSYWIAATASVSAACVVELAVLAVILRFRDPDYLRLPAVAFLIPVGIGLAIAAVLRGSASSAARGASRGVVVASAIVATAGLLAGLLYRGGWV